MCHSDGIVDIDSGIDVDALKPTLGVALRLHLYTIHRVDPLVSLMVFEKVPNSTSEMVGSFDKQIEKAKEVIELQVKHSELFEALSIAQPKGVLLYEPLGLECPFWSVLSHTIRIADFISVSGSKLVQKYSSESKLHGSRALRYGTRTSTEFSWMKSMFKWRERK